MKNKPSDNISNIDSSPERNQAPTQKGEIKLLDVVALTQDVPEHNLKRGEVGTVVEILSNGEAFEVEFSDDNGQMYKCLSFRASQLQVLHQEPIKADTKRQADNQIGKIEIIMLEKHDELTEHWESVRQTVNNTYKDQVEEIIRSTEDLHTSGEYDVYRGGNREYEYVSLPMFRMMRPLTKLTQVATNEILDQYTSSFTEKCR